MISCNTRNDAKANRETIWTKISSKIEM